MKVRFKFFFINFSLSLFIFVSLIEKLNEPKELDSDQLNKLLLKWIISSSCSFKEVDNIYLRRLIQNKNPNVYLPTSNELKEIYENKYFGRRHILFADDDDNAYDADYHSDFDVSRINKIK